MTTIEPMPHKALLSPIRGAAPLEYPELEDDPDPDDPLPPGAVGMEVAETLAKQELAAALAAPTSEGAALLTVALPAKLQDWGFRWLAW